MFQGVPEILPSAVGVAISPLPIVAVLLALMSPKARTNGPALALGWVLGLSAIAAVIWISGPSDDGGEPSDTSGWIQVALGSLFFFLAWKQWQGRPKDGEPAQMPGWMASIDDQSAGQSMGMGLVLTVANPKNLSLMIAAGAALASLSLGTGPSLVAVIVFVLVGSVSVLGPVIYVLARGDAAREGLSKARDYLVANNSLIMFVLFALLGASTFSKGLGILLD